MSLRASSQERVVGSLDLPCCSVSLVTRWSFSAGFLPPTALVRQQTMEPLDPILESDFTSFPSTCNFSLPV